MLNEYSNSHFVFKNNFQTFQPMEVKFRETVQSIEILLFLEKIIKIKSSEMAFPAFWEYVVISDPINCHKVTS
jgi:hypothetical protein